MSLLQNRKAALDLLSILVKERLASPDQMHKKGDVLDHVLEDMKSEKFLTEDFIVQLLFGLSFVSFGFNDSNSTYEVAWRKPFGVRRIDCTYICLLT